MSKKEKPTYIKFGATSFSVQGHSEMTKTEFKKLYSDKFPAWETIWEELKAAKK